MIKFEKKELDKLSHKVSVSGVGGKSGGLIMVVEKTETRKLSWV